MPMALPKNSWADDNGLKLCTFLYMKTFNSLYGTPIYKVDKVKLLWVTGSEERNSHMVITHPFFPLLSYPTAP